MLHDRAEHGGLQMLPFPAALGDGNEIGAQEYPGHAVDLEQPRR